MKNRRRRGGRWSLGSADGTIQNRTAELRLPDRDLVTIRSSPVLLHSSGGWRLLCHSAAKILHSVCLRNRLHLQEFLHDVHPKGLFPVLFANLLQLPCPKRDLPGVPNEVATPSSSSRSFPSSAVVTDPESPYSDPIRGCFDVF